MHHYPWVVEKSKRKLWHTNFMLVEVKNGVKAVVKTINEFSKVKQAIEEHLLAINENSSEITALFDYLQDVEGKMDRLSARLDSLQLSPSCEKYEVSPLGSMERKVFELLYTSAGRLSYTKLAENIGLSVSEVSSILSSLVSKGVVLSRQLLHKQMLVSLDPRFKDLQAKENLVNLSLDTFF